MENLEIVPVINFHFSGINKLINSKAATCCGSSADISAPERWLIGITTSVSPGAPLLRCCTPAWTISAFASPFPRVLSLSVRRFCSSPSLPLRSIFPPCSLSAAIDRCCSAVVGSGALAPPHSDETSTFNGNADDSGRPFSFCGESGRLKHLVDPAILFCSFVVGKRL